MRCEVIDDVDMVSQGAFLLESYLREAGESAYKTYSSRRTIGRLISMVSDASSRLVYVVDSAVVIGLATISSCAAYFEEPSAHIELFYIHPDYRATGASRMLRDTCINECVELGCADILVACNSDMGELN